MARSASIVMSFAVLFAGAAARAGVIVDLGHPTKTPIFGDHPGSMSRSVVFDALTTFDISAAGIRFDPLVGGASAIGVSIYDVALTGGVGTRDTFLQAGQSYGIVDTGMAFYDIPISQRFDAGKRYELAFSSLAPSNWGKRINKMEYYSFTHPSDSPYTVGGLVSVLDGRMGSFLTNDWVNHVRFETQASQTAVPEPSSLVLVGLGAAGLFANGWRRKRSMTE